MAFDGDEREEISHKSEIQRLLKELQDSIIGFENYKKFFDKVQSSDRVIITQIENLTREYREYRERYKTMTEKDSFRQIKDDGFIPLDVFDTAKMMNKILLEAMSWKTLQEEMYSIIFNKLFQVLDDARALDIKRDALKEMREMETQRQEMFVQVMENMGTMFKEAVTSKLQSYDEKLFNLVLMNDEEHRKDRRDIFNSLRDLFSRAGMSKEDQGRALDNFGGSYESKADRIFPQKENDLWNKTKKEISKEDEGFGDMDEEDGNEDIEKSFEKQKNDDDDDDEDGDSGFDDEPPKKRGRPRK